MCQSTKYKELQSKSNIIDVVNISNIRYIYMNIHFNVDELFT